MPIVSFDRVNKVNHVEVNALMELANVSLTATIFTAKTLG